MKKKTVFKVIVNIDNSGKTHGSRLEIYNSNGVLEYSSTYTSEDITEALKGAEVSRFNIETAEYE